MENRDWIPASMEWTFLKDNKLDGILFTTFDSFWEAFNKNSFLVSPNDMPKDDVEKFKIKLRNNAVIIYNTFKGLTNA